MKSEVQILYHFGESNTLNEKVTHLKIVVMAPRKLSITKSEKQIQKRNYKNARLFFESMLL